MASFLKYFTGFLISVVLGFILAVAFVFIFNKFNQIDENQMTKMLLIVSIISFLFFFILFFMFMMIGRKSNGKCKEDQTRVFVVKPYIKSDSKLNPVSKSDSKLNPVSKSDSKLNPVVTRTKSDSKLNPVSKSFIFTSPEIKKKSPSEELKFKEFAKKLKEPLKINPEIQSLKSTIEKQNSKLVDLTRINSMLGKQSDLFYSLNQKLNKEVKGYENLKKLETTPSRDEIIARKESLDKFIEEENQDENYIEELELKKSNLNNKFSIFLEKINFKIKEEYPNLFNEIIRNIQKYKDISNKRFESFVSQLTPNKEAYQLFLEDIKNYKDKITIINYIENIIQDYSDDKEREKIAERFFISKDLYNLDDIQETKDTIGFLHESLKVLEEDSLDNASEELLLEKFKFFMRDSLFNVNNLICRLSK